MKSRIIVGAGRVEGMEEGGDCTFIVVDS